MSQLEANIAAADIRLSDAQMARLNEASAPKPGFTASLAAPFIRLMVFGGNDVTGWSDRRHPFAPLGD